MGFFCSADKLSGYNTLSQDDQVKEEFDKICLRTCIKYLLLGYVAEKVAQTEEEK